MNTEVVGGRIDGGRDVTAFSHNIGINYGTIIQSSTASHYGSRYLDMINFFRSNSVDYRVFHDIAYSLHTPGTGKWLLNSSLYQDWRERKFKTFSCIGIPGAGKTVMSSIVIEDLKKYSPQSIVLIVYNDYSTQEAQTTQLVMLNFLSQILEFRNHSSPQLQALYDEYRIRLGGLPRYDLVKSILVQELSLHIVFIIVDALDEFCPDDPSKSQELIFELETLGCQLLVTSRNPVVSSSNSFEVCTIRASDDDVKMFVDSSLSTGTVGSLLRRRRHLASTLCATVSQQANGM
jgi:hypothetical protein